MRQKTNEPEDHEDEVPKVVDKYLTADPDGQDDLTIAIKATGDWVIDADEDYDWIEASPVSGNGNATITFTVESNDTGKELDASFSVTEGKYKIYNIVVTQAKKEFNVNADDMDFLKAIIEGNMLGNDTPTVSSWYDVNAGAFPGINLSDRDGKLFITAIDGAPLTDFPAKMHLVELEKIKIRAAPLTGKRLPTDWNTPKLVQLELANTGLTGPIPAGLATSSSILREFYADGCQLFGAIPHDWSSKVIEVWSC